jgi:hypothetical protein
MTKAWHLKKNSIKHTGKYSKWNKKWDHFVSRQ